MKQLNNSYWITYYDKLIKCIESCISMNQLSSLYKFWLPFRQNNTLGFNYTLSLKNAFDKKRQILFDIIRLDIKNLKSEIEKL